MEDLHTLRHGFVAFLDGLWWGLRDTTGALSMHDGYSRGFKQIGREAAKKTGGSGPEAAARIAASFLMSIGQDVELREKDIVVKSCPLWDRILERGLEYAFHVEEICWRPLLEGIGELTGSEPIIDNSLRLAHVSKSKIEYKKGKAKKYLDAGTISEEEYEAQVEALEKSLKSVSEYGHYRFQ
ncbi:hypothetical protein EU538_08625 [Candidatus Thorarchaeota archaeon]|nr:MAG: hypothetical protein EU538_08625 [Candidatus Thorarchaeota archaeon]